MCKHGKQILMPFSVRKLWQSHWGNIKFKDFKVDSCLAYTIWKMNTLQGIQTLNSCCGHGRKLSEGEGQILIDSHSVYNAIKHGYDVRKVERWWDSQDGAEIELSTYEIKIK
ncbi:MAG: hypothetical protein ACE5H1_06525 [Thermodesulfobacteriota bacterium]